MKRDREKRAERIGKEDRKEMIGRRGKEEDDMRSEWQEEKEDRG